MEDRLMPVSDDVETLKQTVKDLEERIKRLEHIIATGIMKENAEVTP